MLKEVRMEVAGFEQSMKVDPLVDVYSLLWAAHRHPSMQALSLPQKLEFLLSLEKEQYIKVFDQIKDPAKNTRIGRGEIGMATDLDKVVEP